MLNNFRNKEGIFANLDNNDGQAEKPVLQLVKVAFVLAVATTHILYTG